MITWKNPELNYWLNVFETDYLKIREDDRVSDPDLFSDPMPEKLDLLTLAADALSNALEIRVLTLANFVTDKFRPIPGEIYKELNTQILSGKSIQRPLVLMGTKIWIRDGIPDFFLLEKVKKSFMLAYCRDKGLPCECLMIPFEEYAIK